MSQNQRRGDGVRIHEKLKLPITKQVSKSLHVTPLGAEDFGRTRSHRNRPEVAVRLGRGLWQA